MTAGSIGLGGELFENRELTRGSPHKTRNFLVSLVVHGGVLVAASFGFVVTPPETPPTETDMDMVLVRIPAETPEPVGGQEGGAPELEEPVEQAVARPRAISRRTLRANVATQRRVVRRAVTQVAPTTPTQVLTEVNTVDVQQTQRTRAPRTLTQTQVQRPTTVAPLQVQETQQATEVSTETPTVVDAPTVAQASTGPRVVAAAGPIVRQDDIPYEQATISEGIVGSITIQGDADGPRVRAVDTGSGAQYGRGVGGGGGGRGGGSGRGPGNGYGEGTGPGGGTGTGGGGGQDCSTDPVCRNYLEMIRNRVFARWRPGQDVPGGIVELSFRLDPSGVATGIELRNRANTNLALGESAVDAFKHASPFPAPPPRIGYLVNKNLVATFDFSELR